MRSAAAAAAAPCLPPPLRREARASLARGLTHSRAHVHAARARASGMRPAPEPRAAAPASQVIVDKNPHITTVVNKVGTIENEYRVFNMEVGHLYTY